MIDKYKRGNGCVFKYMNLCVDERYFMTGKSLFMSILLQLKGAVIDYHII